MPAPLQPGDTVLLIATARKVSREEIAPAVQVLESWGLKVNFGKHLFESAHQFAGTDAQRLHDLQQALDDPEAKALFCVRGGYGTTRLVDELDYSGFSKHPKWVVGFSDVTALHCHLNSIGFKSLHATMPLLFTREGAEEAVNSLRAALFGEPISYAAPVHPLNRPGTARGRLLGGNLSLLAHQVGTPSDIDTTGAILFIEDLDEYLYHIDRMLVQLDRTGKLKDLAGLIVGHLSDMKDNTIPFGHTAEEIVHHRVARYNFPVCYGFPVGHETHNLAVICGREAELEVTEAGVTFRQQNSVE